MKKYVTFLTIIFVFNLFAQSSDVIKPYIQGSVKKRIAIDGTHLLTKQYERMAKFVSENPDYASKMRLNKPTAWNFTVGYAKQWNTIEFVNYNNVLVASTCRAVGQNCYIFVQNTQWGSKVTQTDVDKIKTAFDANVNSKGKGIYTLNVENFGNPPDIDSDPKIVVLIYDIVDGYDGGSFIGGYFDPTNEAPKTSEPNSNQAEIYFIDCNPATTSTTEGLDQISSTTAHEFQHMIHYNYHKTVPQLTFVNESCSLVAEVLCGFPIYNQMYYNAEVNHNLTDWRGNTDPNNINDYSRAARFMTYLYEQFGNSLLKLIVQSTSTGLSAIESALSQVTTNPSKLQVKDVLANWFIANKLNDKTINPAWGYVNTGVGEAVGEEKGNINISNGTSLVQPRAVEYLSFRYGSNINITINASSSAYASVKAIKVKSGSKEVVDVPLNQAFSDPTFGTAYNELHFVLINTGSGTNTFTYNSNGVVPPYIELKWDATEPSGVLISRPNDTLCVFFPGVSGARLDSIKVALRQAGSVTGGIWKFSGSFQNPLGEKLLNPITLTSTIAEKPAWNGTSYPIPFPNWVKLDLRDKNISAESDFGVGFLIEGLYPATNRVMITKVDKNAAGYSLAYVTDTANSENSSWYTLVDETGNQKYQYLIRAYVSFNLTDTQNNINQTEYTFELKQNYPNPFNPSTSISYFIPQKGKVEIVIWDIMGNKVLELENGEKVSGNNVSEWLGNNSRGEKVPSGVYFYTLKYKNNVQTKKMMFIK